MREDGLDLRVLAAVTRRGRRLLTVAEIEEEGGTAWEVDWRVKTGRWQRIHAGVLLIGAGAPSWEELLLAATLASNGPAVASYYSALRWYDLGDFAKYNLEITVEHGTDVEAGGVRVHRTRRPIVVTIVRGLPCTSVEQTLLDIAGTRLTTRLLHQVFTNAWRRHLTTPKKLLLHIDHYGGKGVKGTRRLREIAKIYDEVPRPPGSPPEADFFWLLCERLDAEGIERPAIQFLLDLGRDGKFTVDLGWRGRRKLVEVMGAAAHADYVRQDEGYERGALIRSHGWDLRDIAPRAIRERPQSTVRSIIKWLKTPLPGP